MGTGHQAGIRSHPRLDGGVSGRGNADPSISTSGEAMNKDQVKGTIKDAAGKVQEQTGKLTGSANQQVKGLNKQSKGQAQKAVGDVKEAVKNMTSR
jgi:uncharacterized protein YjbJ (UPF0337 family)